MTTLVWLPGEAEPTAEGAVPATDPALLLGVGIFESTRVYDEVPLAFARHLRRLRAGARRVEVAVEWTDGELRAACDRTVARACSDGGPGPDRFHRLRMTVTGGGALVVTVVAADEWPATATVVTVDRPVDQRSLLAGVKATARHESTLILADARRRGADEAIRPNLAGFLCEGTSTNVFLAVDGVLSTPSLATGCLPGVTREIVCESVDVEERDDLTMADLHAAAEVFVTSSTRGVHPVGLLDGEPRPSGPLTAAAASAYAARLPTEMA